MNSNEQFLIKRLKEGDEAAFKVIYNRYVPRLFYFVNEYLHNEETSENIVQNTLMTLWEKREVLHNDTNLSAYLYTVAKNFSLKKLREIRSHQSLAVADSQELEVMANIEALAALDTSDLTLHEIERIIKNTLEDLPPQCSRVFHMSRFEEKKNQQIADELQITVKAVEYHITKALKVLRVNLKDYLPLVAYLLITR